MNDTFKSLIESAQDFLILLPKNSTFDDFSSGLSLYLVLSATGKRVTVSTEAEITAEHSRLIGIDKITKELGNKNLNIRFLDYNPADVDKVSYDIENGQFMLTITPKAGLVSPRNDQIQIDYSGTSAEFVFLLGGESDLDFPFLTSKNFDYATKLVHVGKNILNTQDANLQVLSYARNASSVSEVVTKLLLDNSLPIDADVATNLLAGIEQGSDLFQNNEVTVNTFEIFAHLLKLGGLRVKKVQTDTFPQGSIPTVPYTQTVNQQPNEPVIQNTHITDRQLTPEEAEEELNQEIPPAWSEPKIFTGTSVS